MANFDRNKLTGWMEFNSGIQVTKPRVFIIIMKDNHRLEIDEDAFYCIIDMIVNNIETIFVQIIFSI